MLEEIAARLDAELISIGRKNATGKFRYRVYLQDPKKPGRSLYGLSGYGDSIDQAQIDYLKKFKGNLGQGMASTSQPISLTA